MRAQREPISALPVRPELRLANTGAAYEWLREAVGTGELADLCKLYGRCLVLAGGRYGDHLTGGQLAAIVQARYRAVDGKGQPRMFPTAAAARAVARPVELPHVRGWFKSRAGT